MAKSRTALCSICAWGRPGCGGSMSHTNTSPSLEAEASIRPWCENCTNQTSSGCRSSTQSGLHKG
eukprot:scaffold10678_cov92-Isochrysis_galbana.AAC.8